MVSPNTEDAAVKVTSVHGVAKGDDSFEWEIHKHCHAVSISVYPYRRCHILDLAINGRKVPIRLDDDPELCNKVTLDREFMMKPKDRLSITTRARRGAKISAHLKMTWAD